MVGGIAASAAVRTWPFRVYSFPKEIHISRFGPLVELPDQVTLETTYFNDGFTVWKIDSIGTHILSSERFTMDEATRIFPSPFHWQDYDKLRSSVLQPDGSVVDA